MSETSPWTCFVPGLPRTGQTGSIVRLPPSVRYPHGRAFPRTRHPEWATRIAVEANRVRPPRLLTGPLAVTLTYFRPRPKRTTEAVPTRRPDVGNLSRGAMNALQGLVYRDDAQIVELLERKRYADGTACGLLIRVEVWHG